MNCEANTGITNGASKQSDLLVVGDNPSDDKLTLFADHDIPSLTESVLVRGRSSDS
jgi:BRCT domain type II-containing protein